MQYYREAGRLASIYNAGRRVYNSLPAATTISSYFPDWSFDSYRGDGSVGVAPSQEAADAAYIRRAMGYRLNPAGLPAPSRSSRSSVGSSCIPWVITTMLNSFAVGRSLGVVLV